MKGNMTRISPAIPTKIKYNPFRRKNTLKKAISKVTLKAVSGNLTFKK